MSWNCKITLCLHSRGIFVRCTLLVPRWTPSRLQYCLNSSWYWFNKGWKHFSAIFVCIDTIASCSCCRYVSCTSVVRISVSKTSQKCFIGTGLTWCELCDMECPARSRHQKMDTLWSKMDGQQQFSGCDSSTKGPKECQENNLHTIRPPAGWTIDTRWDGCLLLIPNFYPTIQMLQQNFIKLIRSGNNFLIFCFPVLVNCSLGFSTRCGLLLLHSLLLQFWSC